VSLLCQCKTAIQLGHKPANCSFERPVATLQNTSRIAMVPILVFDDVSQMQTLH
jgi:hypothetical protein